MAKTCAYMPASTVCGIAGVGEFGEKNITVVIYRLCSHNVPGIETYSVLARRHSSDNET